MTWLLIAIGVAFGGFMASEGVRAVVRDRRVSRMALSAPTIRGRYLTGCEAIDRERNVLISTRDDQVVIIGAAGRELATLPRPAPSAILVQSRADYEHDHQPMDKAGIDEGGNADAIAGNTNLQATRRALARVDAICVFDGVAILTANRQIALDLEALITRDA